MLDILDLKPEETKKKEPVKPVKPKKEYKIDYLARYKVYLGYILN